MSNKAFVFDFDDTLVQTDCRVKIYNNKNGVLVKRLSPSEYNNYVPNRDEGVDLSEFEKIIEAKTLPLIDLAKQVNIEGHPIFILTARSPKAHNVIAEFLRQQGIICHSIHCIGSDNGNIDISLNKREVLMSIIESYDTVYFYDDSHKNVKAAEKIGCKARLV